MKQENIMERPTLKGLVLAGGESVRMGFDKGTIDYHSIPQREYVFRLLQPFTTEVFLSARPGQMADKTLPVIEDAYHDLGPFGAILSAFRFDPYCAWLVVACDFPLLDGDSIEQLIEARDTAAMATSFLDTHTLMPEPWISILEPKIYPVLWDYYQKGRSSLRGVLVDFNSTVIMPTHPDILLNANTPEEVQRLKAMVKRDPISP